MGETNSREGRSYPARIDKKAALKRKKDDFSIKGEDANAFLSDIDQMIEDVKRHISAGNTFNVNTVLDIINNRVISFINKSKDENRK